MITQCMRSLEADCFTVAKRLTTLLALDASLALRIVARWVPSELNFSDAASRLKPLALGPRDPHGESRDAPPRPAGSGDVSEEEQSAMPCDRRAQLAPDQLFL